MDDCGYDLSDPKHPTFYDRMAEIWDSREKVPLDKGARLELGGNKPTGEDREVQDEGHSRSV